MNTRNIKQVIFILIMILPIAFSCKTVKEVIKTEVIYDSAAIKENKALRMFLSEEIERFEKEREAWENTGVVFVTEDCPDSAKLRREIPPAKIIFDNGKIKSIEGRVKSLNQSLYEKSSELSEAYSKIDSLGVELEKREVELSKKEKVLVKEVTRKVWPWWIFALCIVIGWIGRGYWPRVKKYFIPIKL